MVSGIKFEPAAVVTINNDPFSTTGDPVVDNNTGDVEDGDKVEGTPSDTDGLFKDVVTGFVETSNEVPGGETTDAEVDGVGIP